MRVASRGLEAWRRQFLVKGSQFAAGGFEVKRRLRVWSDCPGVCVGFGRSFETSGKLHQLKIGTYDKLVQLSDDLEKVSSTVESTTARLHKQLLDSK